MSLASLSLIILLVTTGFSDVSGMRKSPLSKPNSLGNGNNLSKNHFSSLDTNDSGPESEDSTGGDSTSSDSSSEAVERNEYLSTVKETMIKAWNLAKSISGRAESIWRVDRNDNLILTAKLTRSSALAFKALARPNIAKNDNNYLMNFGGKSFAIEAIQHEYYGESDKDNHSNALKYSAGNAYQDNLLSLIEIALNGNVMSEKGDYYCWVPSQIHRDLFQRDCNARRWHQGLYDYDAKYGKAGHALAFEHMGVFTKDVRGYTERALDTMNQINTTMYITDFQPMCSTVVVGDIDFERDPIKTATDRKNNWGLPRVTEFVNRPPTVSSASKTKVNAKSPASHKKVIKKVSVAQDAYDKEYPALGANNNK